MSHGRASTVNYRINFDRSHAVMKFDTFTLPTSYPPNTRPLSAKFVNASNTRSSQSPSTGQSSMDWLKQASAELDEARRDAASEGLVVSEAACMNAALLLRQLAGHVASSPIITVTPECSIAIEFRADARAAVLLLCDSNGSGACFEDIENSPAGYARFADALYMLNSAGWGALNRAKLLIR